ncbi:MAG: BREX system P-loop protein BrxC [Rhodospirillales bacterium]|nr:MAG: BREX system P-loop protein BrxC [Rhodospirillales bacterium]
MQIQALFDPNRDIHRTIEKVITYGADQEQRLKAEIVEYWVTESIEEQTEKLLSKMQAAMEAGGENEIGVWVSGFYGSGKSSFTKYLGLAFDDSVVVDGQPFLRHVQDRLHKPQTRALLATLAKRFPAAVVLLDLASEQIAGATLEVVSTVLYYKVLQWAGYSRNLKVAAFERRLKKDGRYDEFRQAFEAETGEQWEDYQNDPLVVDSVLPRLAHRLYPTLFPTDQSFTTTASEFVTLLDDRVKEILDIVRERSGREYVLFVVDEVGQYVGAHQNKILDLQGLAQNLKNIGAGRAWLVGTAQQTLTEDDPRAAINSPELYKLKDRFPIWVDLEPRDIREICYRRLLSKSKDGKDELGRLFDRHGPALRQNTKLRDAKVYDAELNKEGFVDLYPFLPAHFDLLLYLLGALAKSTGGIGLRSAIKVIQDILIEPTGGSAPVAEQSVGRLATTVTLYDALEKDMRRAFPSIHQAAGRVELQFPPGSLHREVAKTIAVLQILGNIPVTVDNIASLMHPAVDAPSRSDAVKAAVDEMLSDARVPLGERDGELHFFSEKLHDIEQERAQIPLRTAEARRLHNEALREVFSPLPSARIHGSLAVTSGLKAQSGAQTASLAGERETIQTVVEFVDPGEYDTARTRLVDDSRHKSSEHTIFLLGRQSSEADDLVTEMYRSQRIVELHRNEPDQEIRDYCASQTDRAARLAGELQQKLRRSLMQGSFLFRGQTTAVDSLGQSLLDAARKHLTEVAERVFDRYDEAPERADTALAEKFLRIGNLAAITSQLDPLGLVEVAGGTPKIRTDHKALVSIRDYVDRNGSVEGKRLLETFSGAPFGWSPDTLRYLIAALLVAGEIKLKLSGREVTVNGQQAIDALRSNAAFRPIGVALRYDRPSIEVLARAATRLTDLVGDNVLPLEEEISKAAAKHLPQLQNRIASLPEKLDRLGLPGGDAVRSTMREIDDLVSTDASDAPQRLGGESSLLYDGAVWARKVRVALEAGLETTVAALREHQRAIRQLPGSGVPGDLRHEVGDDLSRIDERLGDYGFVAHGAELATLLTGLQSRVADAVKRMTSAQAERLSDAEDDLKRIPEWAELTQEEQAGVLAGLQELTLAVERDISGLQRLIAHEFDLQTCLGETKKGITRAGQDRRRQKAEESQRRAAGCGDGKPKLKQEIPIPETLSSKQQLEDLIRRLEALRDDLAFYEEFDVRFTR